MHTVNQFMEEAKDSCHVSIRKISEFFFEIGSEKVPLELAGGENWKQVVAKLTATQSVPVQSLLAENKENVEE